MRRQRPAIGNPSSTCCGATCPRAGSFLRSRAVRANTLLISLNRADLILFSNRATQIPAPAPVSTPGPPHSIWATSCQRSGSMPRRNRWPLSYADVVLCINLIHIAPWTAAVGRMAAAAGILPTGGVLFLYGPFRRNGCHTAPSDEAFDRDLRARNPAWGVRDLDEGAECVPGRMPEKWEDDHEASEQRQFPNTTSPRLARPTEASCRCQTHGPHARSYRRDGIGVLYQQ